MTKIYIAEQDIIFLSYDEPNAEKNYTDLCQKIPWVKRVHGVKGSDAAHKACADLSETEYFVTVDADNVIEQEFINQVIDLDEINVTENHVFSWCGQNFVNGLQYGNGGLKLWNKSFVNNMKTHEASDGSDVSTVVEFCFDDLYYQFDSCFSISYTNGSPFQAWRAGFREGVKMSLDRGDRVENLLHTWWRNVERLRIWCSVGCDVKNGEWSIFGARLGCYLTNCTDWDYTQVRDFEYLTSLWHEKYSQLSSNDLSREIDTIGNALDAEIGIDITVLDSKGSKFFKSLYKNRPRTRRNRI